MKKILSVILAAFALQGFSAPLVPGRVSVDFSASSSVNYSYTPAKDEMLTFSNLQNVSIYSADVAPADERFGETFRGTLYVQVRQGVSYTITANKGFTLGASSFEFDSYACPWPDGGSPETPIRPFERFCYVPVTLSIPSYLEYSAADDGVLIMTFSSFVNLSGSTSPTDLAEIKTEYQSGGGYKAILDVTKGTTYYFSTVASGSYLCSFELTHPVTGESPDFPYLVGDSGIIPKEAGTYYYKVENPGEDAYMVLQGDGPFKGVAKAGANFTNLTSESTDAVHIRMSVSAYYNEYCLVITRTEAAAADQTFTVSFPKEPTDVFPGLEIAAGTHTTPTFPGLYYYTFTVPTDGRNIISLKAIGENIDPSTSATLYFGDNAYSTLARGSEIQFEAQAGRQYAVTWNVASANVPLTFSLDFLAPGAGESPNNPLPAVIGENSGKGGSSAVYFKYTATMDGWLYVTPGEATPVPAVSMLPIPSDPYMQACEVISDNGSYRVATTAGRGYLLTFFTGATVNFVLSEQPSLQGESASFPFETVDGVAVVPEAVGTYWFAYTTPRAGKLEISTDLAFLITENRVDYSFVRIYSPADPDNQLTQLRPDYDNHVFAPRVIDVEAGTSFLIKVRTMTATDGVTVKLTVRDAIEGEVPEKPIVIPFNGKSGKYTFNRAVNYAEDALWYAITLPAGSFTIKGSTGGAFQLAMYAPDNLSEPMAEADVLDLVFDDDEQMYIYTWGIADLPITKPATYLLHLTDNAVPVEMQLTMTGADSIDQIQAESADGELYDLLGRKVLKPAHGIYIRNGRKIVL